MLYLRYVFNSSGTAIKNNNWSQSPRIQPDNFSKFEHCVHIYGINGDWYDELCNIKKHYICEDTNEDLNFWRACPLTWDLINTKCYHKAPVKMLKKDALNYCNRQNATLFEPTYNKQEQMIIDFYDNKKSFWLGATDSSNKGSFLYQSNGKRVEYTNWVGNAAENVHHR